MDTISELQIKIQGLKDLKSAAGLMLVQESMLIAYEDSLDLVKKLNITPVVECDAEQSLNKSMCPYCKHSNIDEGIGFQRCNNCGHNYWT